MKHASQVPSDQAPAFAYLRQCDLRETDNQDPDDPRRFRYLERLDEVIRLVHASVPAGRVLEAGSAQANLSLLLAEAGYDTVALDLRLDFLRYARSKWEHGRFTCLTANAFALPFREMVFDAVVVGELVEHVADPYAVLREAVRVLKPGGLLVITTPNWSCVGSPEPSFRQFKQDRGSLRGRAECGPGGDDHLFALTLKELLSLLPSELRVVHQGYTACRLLNSRTRPILRRLFGEVPDWLPRSLAALPVVGSRLSQGITVAAIRVNAGERSTKKGAPSENHSARLVGNYLALLGGWFLQGVLSMLVSIVVARFLGPEAMGRYAFLVWLVGLLAVIVSAGIPITLARYTAEVAGGQRAWLAGALLKAMLTRQLVVALLASGILSLAGWTPGVSASWKMLLVLAAASLPSLVLHGTLAAFLAGFQAFRLQALLGVGQLLLVALLVAVAVLAEAGLAGLLLAHALANGVTVAAAGLLVWHVGKRQGAFPSAFTLPENLRCEAFQYVRTVSVLVVVDAFLWQKSGVVFLQVMATPADVAFYALAFGLSSQISRIPSQASVVLFPIFPERVGIGRSEELGGLHLTAMRYLVLVGAPLFTGVIIVAPELIRLFYGNEYLPAAQVLRILAAGSLLACLAGASPSVLHAVKAQRFLVRLSLLAAGIYVALALFLIPIWGVAGAAVAAAVAQGTGSFLAIAAAVRITGCPVVVGPLARILGAALIMAGPVHLTVRWFPGVAGLVCAIILGMAIYLLALRLLRAFSNEDAERVHALIGQWPGWARVPSARLVGLLIRA